MIRIELKFNEEITSLAGNPFGRQIYESQMKKKFDMNDINYLIFPEQIEMIGSSFIQGLFYEYINKYTSEEILEHIKIDNEDLLEDFKDGLR